MLKIKDANKIKKEDEKYCTKGEIKQDNRTRDEVFEVCKDGVSLDWTANITEALSTQKQSLDSVVYSINMATGKKTLRA